MREPGRQGAQRYYLPRSDAMYGDAAVFVYAEVACFP